MDTTPNIAPTAPEKPVVEAAPAAKACPKKKGCGAIILLLVLLVLAGAGACVYFYLGSNNQSKEIARLKETISTYETQIATEPDTQSYPDTSETKEAETAILQNLIDPYLVADGAFNKVFTEGFNEDMMVKIAFYNLNPYNINEDGSGVYANYYSLSDMYKRLFGSEKELEKKNYGTITYEEQYDRYRCPSFGWGGTGLLPVVAIKDYEARGFDFYIDVAYDNPVFCGIVRSTNEGDLEYCVEGSNGNVTKEAVTEFLDKAMDKMPVYRFTFKIDTEVFDNDINAGNGRFVLKDIEQL